MFSCSIKHLVGWLAVAGLGILCTVARGDEGTIPAKRVAVPAVAAQNETRKLLGDLFRADYEQAKKPEEKAALAEKMLQVGNDTNDDPAGQYMLFQLAKEIAIGAASTDVALRAVDAQGTVFEINVPEVKLDTVTAIEKNLKFSKDRQALLATLDQLVEEFLQAERYDLSKKGVTLSIDLARKIPDATAIKQATIRLKEIESREKLFGEVQTARQELATKPDDPTANLTVGRALCLIQGDWEQGLQCLAKCGDSKLKAIAEQELAQPQAADKQMELADAWWDLSEKETGSLQSAMQQRSVAWYQTALPQLTGLAKLKVTGRIEKAGGKPGEGTSVATAGPSKATTQPPQGSPGQQPKTITNSIGMKLVLIPAGTFVMGSLPDEEGRRPDETQHRVKLTKPYYMGTTEVTKGQWTEMMGTTPWAHKANVSSDVNSPACSISWDEAVEFCRKLSEKEGVKYRLPTEAEWEYACRAGTTGSHSFKNSAEADAYCWLITNIESKKAQVVGQKKPNPAGLYDIHGNVAEFCSDWLGEYPSGNVIDPQGPKDGTERVVRGGSFFRNVAACGSARRISQLPTVSSNQFGFRVVCEPQTSAVNVSGKPVTISTPGGSKPAVPGGSGLTKNQNAKTITNSIGMRLVEIPAGTFLMGSPPDEPVVREGEIQHRVTLTKPFYMGMTEVTQGQWTAVMGTKPWQEKKNIQEGPSYAASYMSWEDAVEFCRKLSEKESKSYRLPTEAEWEYACRAGTQTATNFSDPVKGGECAWSLSNAGHAGQAYPHEVAQKLPNAAGLYDMLGNVRELCSDWHAPYSAEEATDPQGPATGTRRVTRGGSWGTGGECFRSAHRYAIPTGGSPHQGFRVVLETNSQAAPAVKPTSSAPQPSSSSPTAGGPSSPQPGAAAESQPATPAPKSNTLATPKLVTPADFKQKSRTNTLGMKLVEIPAGTFIMGSFPDERARDHHEDQHRVSLTKPFYMGTTEVTQAQWTELMETRPWQDRGPRSPQEGPNYPASYVSWDDAVEFCSKLSAKEGKRYRLPTEAEWEYACRAGTTTAYHCGDPEKLVDYAWFHPNAAPEGERKGEAHLVAQKLPNAAGLYDMHGNLSELCSDFFLFDFKLRNESPSDAIDPQGPASGRLRIMRGGNWSSDYPSLRSARGYNANPQVREPYTGFRVVCEP